MRRDQVDKKIQKKGISIFVTSLEKDDFSGLQKIEMSIIACRKSHVLDICELSWKNIEGENETFAKIKVFLCLIPANENEPQCQELHLETNMQNLQGESSN